MAMMRFAVWFLVGLMFLIAGGVSGQDYPNKPIRIVTAPIGGGSDLVARIIAQGISGPLGQPVIVDNRVSRFQADIVGKAPPDGYTLLHTGGNFYIVTLLEKTTYDPVRDFSPITLTDRSLQVLVVPPSLPVKSVKELIALAKARPGELNYSGGPIGGGNHLAAELFKAMAGVSLVYVAYKGGDLNVTAVLGAEVQLTFANSVSVTTHVKTGRLRALAVTSAQPSVLLPGLPTVAETVPGYEAVPVTGVFAPAKTPATIIKRLNQEIVRVLNGADVKERLFNVGLETVGSSPEQFAATIKSEMDKWGKVIKDTGIKSE